MLLRFCAIGVLVVLLCCFPGAAQYENPLYENCTTGKVSYIADGTCNGANNSPECGYDGGDCCVCTCVDSISCTSVDCIDPVAGDEFYNCEIQPPAGPLCSAEVQQSWEVGNTAQARALAKATNCSGGSFHVMWRGNILLDETIYVVDGTVLDVYGVGTDAAISGSLDKRLITVMNASLYLTDVSINFGSALVGGAIAASASRLILNQTSFIGNRAGSMGGALYVVGGSRVTFNGYQTTFYNNAAVRSGGAIYVAGGSVISWKGQKTNFTDNLSEGDGGGITIRSESTTSWIGEVVFSNNICGRHGGTVYTADHARVAWDGAVLFSNNTAAKHGGAIIILADSKMSGTAEMTFYQNFAGEVAGGLYIGYNSTFSWTGKTRFEGNRAGLMGGALTVFNNSDALSIGDMLFARNSAKAGGAVIVGYKSTISWGGNTNFTSNLVESGSGGAVLIIESSQAFWGGVSTFTNNSASDSGEGGAVAVMESSTASWNSEIMSTRNSAGAGGALFVAINCTISYDGKTTFDRNTASSYTVQWTNEVFPVITAASFAGAVYVGLDSSITWSGETMFSSNTAGNFGGALMLDQNTKAFWNEKTTFFNNSAPDGFGGAVVATETSSASWNSGVTFTQNSARAGGALFVMTDCTVSYDGNATFDGNIASSNDGGALSESFSTSADTTALSFGGAVYVALNSTIFWSGNTIFSSNTAEHGGGALALDQNSKALWIGKTVFYNNIAADSGVGGALYAIKRSSALWKSDATFARNSAGTGGALYVDIKCTISFDGKTTFDGNFARGGQGGALSVSSSDMYWRNKTIFAGNTAISFGGAVAFMADISASSQGSLLVLGGSTVFVNNTCETNGGALGLIGGVVVTLETTDITLAGNRAEVAGGAIYMWGNDLGPEFVGVSVLSNYAQHGGGVYSTGSGNALIGLDGEQRSNPVVYNGCIFSYNIAVATGGAIQSAAGQDVVTNTAFVGNKAAEGGALNLAGTALLVNCSFNDNISDEGGGPVVSNIGYVSGISNCTFLGNAYSCEPETFLDYNSSNNVFDVICKGCKEQCEECVYERPSKTPFCVKVMENTHSPGGLTTLEQLSIEPGYWRATPSGQEVLPCYNSDACLGGLTGAPNFCLEGYEGPYCSICSNGYRASWSFTCKKCSTSTGSVVLAIVLLFAILVAMAFMVAYLFSAELERGTKVSCVEWLVRCIPVQSFKIVIVVWQIMTQFVSVANVQFPHEYQQFLDGVKLLDFDLRWILSASCLVDIDFHGQLMFATVSPVVVVVFLGITYKIAERRNRQSRGAVRNIKHKHLSAVLLLTFYVYANVSSILFQAFSCEHLENGKLYLRADYRIECDSTKHVKLQGYAGFMIILYTVGIPAFYSSLLFKTRDVLRMDETFRDSCTRVRPTSSLWKPYKPSAFYFEVIECARRALLAGVVVFFNPDTASQIAVTLILVFAFALISGTLDPYASRWDTWLSRTGHVVVFVSVYVALLLKVDVSTERHDSQRSFEIILIIFNICMIAAVVIEAFVIACSLECLSGRGRENGIASNNQPRFRSTRWPMGRIV